jgi:hypothetical protein
MKIDGFLIFLFSFKNKNVNKNQTQKYLLVNIILPTNVKVLLNVKQNWLNRKQQMTWPDKLYNK